ncbi:MAG: Eco57I restriction-modification methylase domain-containing protein, partial [Alphaproteobacteria bacterium]|nr:Eco57I restriction-modification methylase domain-containing protein [Alphaproteobacteria bacterium]
VDIARLRFWLSLVIDEEKAVPLPNLDYKIMQGNSLLEQYEGIDLSKLQINVNQTTVYEPQKDLFGRITDGQLKMTFTQETTVNNLQQLLKDYFYETKHSEKTKLKKEITKIVNDHILYNIELRKTQVNRLIGEDEVFIRAQENKIADLQTQFPNQKLSPTLTAKFDAEIQKARRRIADNETQLQKYDNALAEMLKEDFLSSNQQFFLWHTWFADVFNRSSNQGFDVVIGNPPYFLYQGSNKTELSVLKTVKKYEIAFGGKINAYKLFLANALQLLVKKNGINAFIFQNSFLADLQAVNLRNYVLSNCKIIVVDSFPERDSKKKRVFESVKMSVCILIVQNQKSEEPFTVNIWNDKDKSSGITTHFTKNELVQIDPNSLTIPRLDERAKPIVMKMIKKRSVTIKCLEGELNITFHRSFFSDDSNLPTIMKGAGIQKYFYTFDMSQGQIEYLKEKEYLDKFGESAKAHHHEFERIVMQGMTGANDKIRLVMCLVPKGMYLGNSCNYIIPSKDIPQKYLLGLMNSTLVNFFFRCFSTNSNVNGYEIESIPIPTATSAQQQPIINLVDSILAAKKDNSDTDTSAMEIEIDKLVYQLYGLSYNEVLIVDPNTPITKEEYEVNNN